MFVHAVPDNRGKKDEYYCSLVKSHRINGISRHETVLSFGLIPAERLPYLMAAFNRGDPEAILDQEKHSQESRMEKKQL